MSDVSARGKSVNWVEMFKLENSQDSIRKGSNAGRPSCSDIDNRPSWNWFLESSHGGSHHITYEDEVTSLIPIAKNDRWLLIQGSSHKSRNDACIIGRLAWTVHVEVPKDDSLDSV